MQKLWIDIETADTTLGAAILEVAWAWGDEPVRHAFVYHSLFSLDKIEWSDWSRQNILPWAIENCPTIQASSLHAIGDMINDTKPNRSSFVLAGWNVHFDYYQILGRLNIEGLTHRLLDVHSVQVALGFHSEGSISTTHRAKDDVEEVRSYYKSMLRRRELDNTRTYVYIEEGE